MGTHNNVSSSENQRACILTMTGLFNHGNRLQNYALTRMLEGMGFEVETYGSSYRPPVANIKWHVNRLLGRSKDPNVSQDPDRLTLFQKFNERMVVHRVFRIPANLDTRFDVFVAGSDQIWNPYFVNDHDAYFLRFAQASKRVAYAASIGAKDIPPKLRNSYRRGIAGMRAISVREDEAAGIVKGLTGIHPAVVLDPTLLLPASEWAEVEKRPDIEATGGPFLFKYVLGTDMQSTEIEALADTSGLALVDMKDGSLPVGPAEFLWLAHHSSLTCTDSFHACVFSLLFHRPFVVYDRGGTRTDMSSRFSTLFDKLDVCGHRQGVMFGKTMQPDWMSIDQKLVAERATSLQWLEEAIHG